MEIVKEIVAKFYEEDKSVQECRDYLEDDGYGVFTWDYIADLYNYYYCESEGK